MENVNLNKSRYNPEIIVIIDDDNEIQLPSGE